MSKSAEEIAKEFGGTVISPADLAKEFGGTVVPRPGTPAAPAAPAAPAPLTQRNTDYIYTQRGYIKNPINPNAKATGKVSVFTDDGRVINVDLGASKLPAETTIMQEAMKTAKPYDIADHPEDVANMRLPMRLLMNAGITGRKLAGSAYKLGKGALDFATADVGPAGIEDFQAAGDMVKGVANLPAATSDVATAIKQGAQAGDVKQMGEGVDKFVTEVAPNMLMLEGAVRGATGTTGLTNIEAARSILKDVTTPEARMMAATNQRAALASTPTVGGSIGGAIKSGLNANSLDLVNNLATGGMRIARKAAAPINEALAQFMTKNDVSPFANYRGRLDSSMFKDEPGPRPADEVTDYSRVQSPDPNFGREGYRTGADVTNQFTAAERGAPEGSNSYRGTDKGDRQGFEGVDAGADAGAGKQKYGIERPSPEKYKADVLKAIEEDRAALARQKAGEPQLEAPDVNRWLKAKLNDMRHGADAGAQLMEEKLIGPDKLTTLENVKPALENAGVQIDAALKAADKTGKTINAKSILDEIIADKEKTYSRGTDADFEAKKGQFSTDAFEKFSDYDNMTPSRAHEFRKWVRKAITKWSGSSTPYELMLKDLQGKLNTAISDINPDVKVANRRWGNLALGERLLQEGIIHDKRGVGTGPVPTPKRLAMPRNVPRTTQR